ncbi:MAG: tetratricopeptide repeat protein [Gemmataceae bacterium]
MSTSSRASSYGRFAFPLAIVAVGLVVAGIAVSTYWSESKTDIESPNQPSPDPRVAFKTDFRNVRPGVKYVGDAECSLCHREVCQSYHNHPMGRSASLVRSFDPPEKNGAAANLPVRTDTHQLQVVQKGQTITHKVTAHAPATAQLPALELPVQLAIGSGALGRSYISVTGNAVWQTPISWFTDEDRWNVSPGFQLGNGMMRPVGTDCFFCHINQIEPVPNSKNRFEKPFQGQLTIGCERCHGPGELHVNERLANQGPVTRDTSIVNPKHLDAELQKDICRQCHMLGESRTTHFGRSFYDFRPGLPLSHVMSIFISAPELADDQRSVGQFEQMERSGCYIRGNRTMTCTSCHNPHVSPANEKKAEFYRSRCLSCHEQKGCREKQELRNAQQDSCVVCHMPQRKSHNVAHASLTDHTIPRKKLPDQPRKTSDLPPGLLPIVRYQTGPYAPTEADQNRDFAIALSKKLPTLRASRPVVLALASLCREQLLASIQRWEKDDQALISLASLASTFGDHAGRLKFIRQAVDIAPDSEDALVSLAETEIYAGHYAEALAAADRLIGMVPLSVEYRLLRASVCIAKQDWPAADAALSEAQKINPLSAESHVLRALCLDGMGKSKEAQAEFDAALALETNPDVQKQYRSWFRPKK